MCVCACACVCVYASQQGESTVRSLTHNAPRMTHGRAGRLYYERPATVHGARAKAQSEQGAAPLKNTVAPVVMFHLLDKVRACGWLTHNIDDGVADGAQPLCCAEARRLWLRCSSRG